MDHIIEILSAQDEPDSTNQSLRRRAQTLEKVDSRNLPNLIRINQLNGDNLIRNDDLYRSFSLEGTPAKTSKLYITKKSTSKNSKPRNSKSTYRKLSLISDKNEDNAIMIDFGNAIRSGSIEMVSSMLDIHGSELMNQLSIQFETHFRKSFVTKVENALKPDLIYMTPFHLAIISQQWAVVQVMLERSSNLKSTLGAKTKVTFATGDPLDYTKEDRTMDGINAFHLAGRFHAHSLALILRFLRDIKLLDEAKELLEAKDPHMGKTPLHMAVKSPSHVHAALFILAKVDLEAKDNRGYTALHMAAKDGNEQICKTLLESGTDPNVHGKRPDYFKTPLHRARSKKVVKLLLKHGADPFARSVSKNGILTVLDTLLRNNPEAANEVLNYGIETNGQEHDSSDFQIIYNFELLHRSKNGNEIDEMTTLRKIASISPVLLQNPLVEGFLNLKWQMWKHRVYCNVILMALFLMGLTGLLTINTRLAFCTENPMIPGSCTDLSFNGTTLHYIMDAITNHELRFDTLSFLICYAFTSIYAIYLTFGEVMKAIYSPISFISWEYFPRFTFIILTIVYLVLLLFEPITLTEYFGILAIVNGCWNFVMMLGKIPSFGNPIFLLISILELLAKYFLLFLPILVSFAVVFRALMPISHDETDVLAEKSSEFVNILYALLKVTAMMVGELDFRETFLPHIQDSVYGGSGKAFISIFFFLFVAIMSIVMVNLLIGLTVNKTEELSKLADIVRLEKIVDQVHMAENFNSSKIMRRFHFCPKEEQNHGKIFYCLKKALQHNPDASFWKVCILPHSREEQSKKNSMGRKILSFHHQTSNFESNSVIKDRNYTIYAFDDRLNKHTVKLPFRMPYRVVRATLALLKNRKAEENKKYRNLLEREISTYMDLKEIEDFRRSQSSDLRTENRNEKSFVAKVNAIHSTMEQMSQKLSLIEEKLEHWENVNATKLETQF